MPGESLRDQLQSSYDALVARDGDNATPAEAAPPAPAAETEGAAAAPEAPPSTDGQAPADGQPRNDKGQFAPKDPEAKPEAPKTGDAAQAKTPSETAKPEAEDAGKDQPIRVPPSLPAAVKAKFATLEPDVQQAFVKLEESVQTAKAEWGKKGERLNRFDEIVGPHADRFRMNGIDEFQGVQALLSAQALLDRDPINGLIHVARSYGVNPAQLAQAFGLSQASAPQPGQEGQPAPTAAPDLAAALRPIVEPLQQQVQTLQQQLATQAKQTEAEKLDQAMREVEAFASRPENMYWPDVKNDVARLIEANPTLTLAQAYESAIWASPVIRPLLLQAQAQPQGQAAQVQAQPDPAAVQRAAEAAARAKAEAARNAGGSVTGAPQGGAQAQAPSSTGNLRADLEASYRAHAGV